MHVVDAKIMSFLKFCKPRKLRPVIRRNRLKKFFERGTELFLNGSQRLHDRTALFVLHLAQTGKPALALCNGKKSFLPPTSTKHEVGFPMPEGCTCHNTRITIVNAMPIGACFDRNAAVSLLSSSTLRQIDAFDWF